MSAIILDEYRELFRSEADFERFTAVLEAAGTTPEMTSVWANKRHLATLLAPGEARLMVRQRMTQRLLDEPALLDRLKQALTAEEVVE